MAEQHGDAQRHEDHPKRHRDVRHVGQDVALQGSVDANEDEPEGREHGHEAHRHGEPKDDGPPQGHQAGGLTVGCAGDDHGDVGGQQRKSAWVECRDRTQEECEGGGRGVDQSSPFRWRNLMAKYPIGIRAQ